MNAIIKRAIPSASDVTATEALVLKERRKELVMEGHRFYDIMRLGITVTRKGWISFLEQHRSYISELSGLSHDFGNTTV